jgi:hypothetical protein
LDERKKVDGSFCVCVYVCVLGFTTGPLPEEDRMQFLLPLLNGNSIEKISGRIKKEAKTLLRFRCSLFLESLRKREGGKERRGRSKKKKKTIERRKL